MADNSFFDEGKEQSKVKTAIVCKYFDRWARIMMATQDRYPQHGNRIAYADLFAGPGRYKDGTISTPLVILEKATTDENLRNRLVTLFNDKNEDNSKSLEATIQGLKDIETLKYSPTVLNNEVGTEMAKLFESFKTVPTLFFVDPWGYKGLSLQLINTVIKDWGCDCLFFFNYTRVNMGVSNDIVKHHTDALFGERISNLLRARLEELSPMERENAIVEEICRAIKEIGNNQRFVLPFAFKNESGKRTSHHLIFVSKNFKGYEEMKLVMAQESSGLIDGVSSFEYSPATERQPLLFSLARPIEDLELMLLNDFKGQSLTMRTIYENHNVDLPYIAKNYKVALGNLLDRELIDAPKRRKGSFGDDVVVTFPK